MGPHSPLFLLYHISLSISGREDECASPLEPQGRGVGSERVVVLGGAVLSLQRAPLRGLSLQRAEDGTLRGGAGDRGIS